MDRTERRKAGPPSSRYANEPEIAPRDAPLLETPSGRENDCGAADKRSIANRENGARPRSEITGQHEPGTGAVETKDGLDERSEEARRAAEDRPAGGGREDRARETPVFERGLSTPKA